jgi:amino acid transporter
MHKKITFIAQLVSLSLIWIFVISIAVWIINLILLSVELNDVPGASIGISIITIPVFFALASVLTYVFIGLQKEEKKLSSSSSEQ